VFIALRHEGEVHGLAGVERRPADPPFTEADVWALEELAPALSLVASYERKQSALRHEAAAVRALGHVRGDIVIIDISMGKVVYRDGVDEAATELDDSLVSWVQQLANEGAPPSSVAHRLPSGGFASIVDLPKGALGRPEHVAVHVVGIEADDPATRALSAREREIALLLANGLTHVKVGAICRLSPHTVRTYIRRLYSKLGIQNRAGLARALSHWAHRGPGLSLSSSYPLARGMP
jgi:DNA-binding NarL/FixJ family response regulator